MFSCEQLLRRAELLAAKQTAPRATGGATVAIGKATTALNVVSVLHQLPMRGWNDKTVLEISNRQQLIHFINLQGRQADALGNVMINNDINRFRALVRTNGQHALS